MELDLDDLDRKCRVCLSENTEMYKIYSDFDSGVTLDEILTDTTGLSNDPTDGLSPFLCQNCTTTIVEFYNLKTVYREYQRQIKEMLKNQESETATIKLEAKEEQEEISLVLEPIEDDEYQQVVSYTCPECAASFLHEADIKKHLRIVHNLGVNFETSPPDALPVRCKICHLEFPSQLKYKKHIEIHKKHVCPQCGAAFVKKSYLNDHIEVHTNERKHVCSICSKAFRRRTVLVKHKKIHTHRRQFICEVCGNAFKDKGTLKTHILLKHTNSRNFQCDICGQKFSLKSTLEKHIRRHDGREREFVCELCPAAYKDKSSLDRHVVVKHNEEYLPVACKVCGGTYSDIGNLMKHMRRCHGVVKELVEENDGQDEQL